MKAEVDKLDVGKLKTGPIDLKKLSDVVNKEVVKNTKLNKINTKVNKLDKKMSEATTLININQCKAGKQNLEKKIGDVDKKYQTLVV